MRRLLFVFFISFTSLVCEQIETFYGPIEVTEPVLLELIHSPAMNRLRDIHQYGVSYYTKTHPEEYNRYDHSVGVFTLLRLKGASLEEQIAGLLHDISHTAFSHVGDWVFNRQSKEEDYQTFMHRLFLAFSGIEEILIRHGYSLDRIDPKRGDFHMLEQPLPDLCADRIDYNIQGAYFQNFLTKDEAKEIFDDLCYEKGRWVLSKVDLARKLANYSLFMSEDCWGSPINYITSFWLAEAIIRGIETLEISWYAFHFDIDDVIWSRLINSKDELIQKKMEKVLNPLKYFSLSTKEDSTQILSFKCRGIDPWILTDGRLDRLSKIDDAFSKNLARLRNLAKEGWSVKISEID